MWNTTLSTKKRSVYSLGGCAERPRTSSPRRCQALSSRPSQNGKLPPPWAKHTRSDGGTRSNTPPRIIASTERCVSAGIPDSQRAIQRSWRGPLGMSHGWTNTGAPTSAQCCRNSTTPSSSRSRSPTWLPISTPAWPAARQRSSSAHAASGSWSGTWQNGISRSPPSATHSSVRSLKILATLTASPASRS